MLSFAAVTLHEIHFYLTRFSFTRSITCSVSRSNVLNHLTGFPSDSVCNESFSHPMRKFYFWLQTAISHKIIEPSAMCLTTVDDNKPSTRYVIMREYNEECFTFYTNSNSRKGLTLAHNSNAAATFQWLQLERSVNIEGIVEKFTEEENDTWFKTVPNSRKLMYWISNQSEVVDSVATMVSYEQQVKDKFTNVTDIPRPPHWSGYRLMPHRITFLSGYYSYDGEPCISESYGNNTPTDQRITFEKKKGGSAGERMEWIVTENCD